MTGEKTLKSVEQVRTDFPILNELIYLDSASTSLTPKQVVESMNEYYLRYNAKIGRGAYRKDIKSNNMV
jgi:cysteine desulfurase/selenocysteine lyase